MDRSPYIPSAMSGPATTGDELLDAPCDGDATHLYATLQLLATSGHAGYSGGIDMQGITIHALASPHAFRAGSCFWYNFNILIVSQGPFR